MDVCCLNRPFDDLSQDRGRSCEKGKWTGVDNPVSWLMEVMNNE
ncbi:hypothetical protein R83H12_02269 [Fibrobacteria bacterium R8-3-H12]